MRPRRSSDPGRVRPREEHTAVVSRRGALAAGAAAALGAAGVVVLAPGEARAQAEGPRDLMLLNGLLATEYHAIQTYESAADVLAAPAAGDPLAALAPAALAIAAHFEGQHREHAAQLVATIRSAGGTPADYDEVSAEPRPGFTPTVANVLALATNAEKYAALLYANSLRAMDSRLAAELVAAIGGAETQHFIVLSLLAQGVAAPTAMTLALANDVVPRAFVVQTAAGTAGLEQVPDFDFD